MYPYRYRSSIWFVCLIIKRYPLLFIILGFMLVVSSELRGCDHHEVHAPTLRELDADPKYEEVRKYMREYDRIHPPKEYPPHEWHWSNHRPLQKDYEP